MNVIVIGGGIAGTTAAQDLRKADDGAQITIIGREQHPCYSRVLLPHYVKGKVPRERVFLKKDEWYEEQNIEYMRGVYVKKIDTQNKFVLTSEERELPYDKLLITTGGDVNLIEQDLRGVSYFYTIDDADHLLTLLNGAQEGSRGLVYGGGFLALEYINIFAHFEMPCTVFIRSAGFWSRILGEESQRVLLEHTKASGVELVTGATEFELMGETELTGVRANGAEYEGSILGVGIGIHTDRQLFEAAGLEHGNGLVTNEFLETGIEDVYAAGDVAEFMDVTVGRRHVAGNWMSAQMQGRAVAQSMLGEKKPFALVSSYATNLRGKEIVFIGDVDRAAAENVVQHAAEEGSALETFERAGVTVGAVLIGDVTKRKDITQAIKDKVRYTTD
jgi:NAD(P)H-nitrite reductase large subunit